jgi:hypothetical protein
LESRQTWEQMGLGYSLWVASLRTADLASAKGMAAEADGLLRRVGAPMGVAHIAEGRGIIAFELGEIGEAANFVTDAVQAFASYGNIGCTAHALEAAAVVIGMASQPEPHLAMELLAAADELRRRSGQGHRPWEIRARLGNLEDRILTPSAAASTPTPAGRECSLSEAASLAIGALRSLTTATGR